LPPELELDDDDDADDNSALQESRIKMLTEAEDLQNKVCLCRSCAAYYFNDSLQLRCFVVVIVIIIGDDVLWTTAFLR
jgi:hypothetical protein